MSDYHKKPGTPGDILKLRHHGVKGMHWGDRKEEEVGGDRKAAKINYDAKAYMAASQKQSSQKLSEAQIKADIAKSQAQWNAKFEPSGAAPSSGKAMAIPEKKQSFVSQHKKEIIGGVALAALVGASIYAGKQFETKQLNNVGFSSWDDVAKAAGKPIDANNFSGLCAMSKGKTWPGRNFIQTSSYARPEFELPAGHTFHRLSTRAEDRFMNATYSVHSLDDFNRYVAGFKDEKGPLATFHHISWKSTEPIKIPNLHTVLGTLHGILEEDAGGQKITPNAVIKDYQAMSGVAWSSPRSRKLLETLKQKGYGALVDEMDAGVIGDTPLVFFGHEKAGSKTSEKFTTDLIKQAEKLVKEINNPPGRKL